MASKQISVVSTLLAVAISAVAASGAYENWKTMDSKAKAQAKAVEEFSTWKRQYTQLLPVEQKWKGDLSSVAVVKDLYSVYTVLGTTPRANPDTLLVDRVDRLSHDGTDLGAQRVCLTSAGSNGVRFEEESFDELMTGLGKLAARPDVQMGSATFTYDRNRASATVRNLCLLLRDEEGAT